LGAWAYPVNVIAIIYGAVMLVNILAPTGATSPRSVLFNYDWVTLLVVVIILAIGGIYFFVIRPDRKITAAHPPVNEVETAAAEA
jgi:hypothetical protein